MISVFNKKINRIKLAKKQDKILMITKFRNNLLKIL